MKQSNDFLYHLQQNGTLKIIDRKKHIFKLSQAEYIAPERIEQILVQSTPVGQVCQEGCENRFPHYEKIGIFYFSSSNLVF